MKLQQLRFFTAVYEQGSFSAAAEKVSATQSGLSMHVSQIEKRYDVALFDRSSSGVTPTKAGRDFYKEAIKVLAAARNAEERLKTLARSVVGQINIGLMPTFTRAVLAPALLRFSDEYPEVSVSITEAYSGALAGEVAEERLDFAVVPASFELMEVFDLRAMGQDRECFVCAADSHIQATKRGLNLSTVAPLRLILPGAGNARRHRIESYLKVNDIEVSGILEIDTMHGTLDLVARSDWVTILPSILCLPDLDGTRRKVYPLSDPPLTVDYMRIQTGKRPLSIAAQAFADVLQEELNEALEFEPLV